jgi:hypothetical protein
MFADELHAKESKKGCAKVHKKTARLGLIDDPSAGIDTLTERSPYAD